MQTLSRTPNQRWLSHTLPLRSTISTAVPWFPRAAEQRNGSLPGTCALWLRLIVVGYWAIKSAMSTSGARRPRLQAVMIAFCVAFTATLLDFVFRGTYSEIGARLNGSNFRRPFPSRAIQDAALLIFGLLLVASHPRRSGITLGTRDHRRKVLTVMVFIVGGALAFRLLDGTDVFGNWISEWSLWAISPIAQELVFSGFILGLLNQQFPRWWHPKVPISTATVISALLFGFWHFIPDFVFQQRDMDYIFFRLFYTAGGWLFYAMTRLWTGTILYAVLMHIAVNFVTVGV